MTKNHDKASLRERVKAMLTIIENIIAPLTTALKSHKSPLSIIFPAIMATTTYGIFVISATVERAVAL